MSYSKERDEFIAIVTSEGLSVDVAKKLLRYATTLHRLAEAQCNGDWPADNGERKVEFCPRCESGFVKSVFKHSTETTCDCGTEFQLICPDCRTAELVRASLQQASVDYWKAHDLATHNLDMTPRTDYVFKAIVNGDPRGAVLKITVPSGKTNDWGQEGIYVPARHR